MHKAIANLVKKELGDGEKHAPMKSLKLKVKFQKAKSEALKKKTK